MQDNFFLVIAPHLRDFLTGGNTLSLLNQSLPIVSVSGQHPVAVLDDNQFSKTDQAVAAVDHIARCRSNDVLSFTARNVNPLAAGVP